MELRNPRVKCHPYNPGPLEPFDQILELELSNDPVLGCFAPGAESWGRMRFMDQPNLSVEACALLENFLALAETADTLAKNCSMSPLKNVRLMYISVLSPETFAKMRATKKTPRTMIDKTYSSHVLRLVVSSRDRMDEWDLGQHTFGNLQKAINSQSVRLQETKAARVRPRKTPEERARDEKERQRKREKKEREKQAAKRRRERERTTRDLERRLNKAKSDEEKAVAGDALAAFMMDLEAEEGEPDAEEVVMEEKEGEERYPVAAEEPPWEKWKREGHFRGIWDTSAVPVFENPKANFRGQGPPPLYSYVHQATANTYRQMVDKYMHSRPVVNDPLDINDPDSSYNPVNVFSPMGNFLRRQQRLLSHKLYAKLPQAVEAKDENDTEGAANRLRLQMAKVQQEIRPDKWLETQGPLSAPPLYEDDEEREFAPEAVLGWPTPYDGETCWLLDLEDFRAATFRYRLFPWAGRVASNDDTTAAREKRAFVDGTPGVSALTRSFLLPGGVLHAEELLGPGERALMSRVMTHRDDVEALYDHQVNMKPVAGGGAMTMRRWGLDNLRRFAEMEAALKKKDPEEKWLEDTITGARYTDKAREMRARTQQDCIDVFQTNLHTAEASAPMAVRSAAKWYNDGCDRARENKTWFNMSFPHDRKHNNLSVLGDAVAAEMDELEQLFFVSKGHELIMAKLLGGLQVFVPFHTAKGVKTAGIHPNFLNQSKAGSTGKSFLDEVVKAHFIPNTFMMAGRLTPQFMTGSDYPPDEDGYIQYYHHMQFFFDEMPQGLLEYDDDGAAQSKFSSDNTSLSETVKTIQTLGLWTWVGPLMDTTGKSADRGRGQINVRCEVAFHCNTNASLLNVSHASMSRNIVSYAKQFRQETEESVRPNVTAKMTQESNMSPVDVEKRHRRVQRWHRNQFIASLVSAMIEGAVIEPIDTSCTDRIYQWVQQNAHKGDLMGFDMPRNFDMFRSIVQALVLFELCHRMFDMVGAPFAQRAWTFHDVLWFQKHLVSTTEHATIAFGLMRSSFENSDLVATTKLLYEYATDVHKASSALAVDEDERNKARLDKENDNRRKMGAAPLVALHSTKEAEAEKDRTVLETVEQPASKTYYRELRIRKPRVFSSAGGKNVNQLVKQLAAKLYSLRAPHSWAYHLTQDGIVQALHALRGRSSSATFFRSEDDTPVNVRCAEILRLETDEIVLGLVLPDVEKERDRVFKLEASLLRVIQAVLQHEYCSTARDFVYGASLPDLPHVLGVVSVHDHGGVGVLRVANDKGDEEPLMEDIDKWFVTRFNARIDVGKLVLRAFPSNDPVELMFHAFLFQAPHYEIRPPYPTHEPAFFAGEFLTRRKCHQLRAAKQKKRRMLTEAEQEPRLADQPLLVRRELSLDKMVLDRASSHAKERSRLQHLGRGRSGMTARVAALLEGGLNGDNLARLAVGWLNLWANDTEPLDFVYLCNPSKVLERQFKRKRKRDAEWTWPLRESQQHPFTSMALNADDGSRKNYHCCVSRYRDTVKTHQDTSINHKDATLCIDNYLWTVRNGVLCPKSAPDPFAEERVELGAHSLMQQDVDIDEDQLAELVLAH